MKSQMQILMLKIRNRFQPYTSFHFSEAEFWTVADPYNLKTKGY